jgi:hypothetical protein
MNTNEIDTHQPVICRKCGQSKPLTEFGRDKFTSNGICRVCKECNRIKARRKYFKYKARYDAYAKLWRNSNKEKANAIGRRSGKRIRLKCKALRDKITMNNPCCHCKENRIACLDFHHLDPTVKEHPVARCSSEKDLLEEASKCIILCANCHRLLHSGDIQLQNPTLLDVSKFVTERATS